MFLESRISDSLDKKKIENNQINFCRSSPSHPAVWYVFRFSCIFLPYEDKKEYEGEGGKIP